MKPSLAFLALSFALIAAGIALEKGAWTVPRAWNPFQPLHLDDPLTLVTQWKLRQLKGDREACRDVLDSAPAGTLNYTPLEDYTQGNRTSRFVRN